MIEILFYFFAIMAVVGALGILFTNNVLYAAGGLVITFLSIAVLYVLANAEFLAVTQIMIYVGGIVVLMIFGVMLTNKIAGKSVITGSKNRFIGGMIALFVFVGLLFTILKINLPLIQNFDGSNANNIEVLGVGLMSNYLLPFEIAAILLLMALIGAATIAYTKKSKS